MEERVTKGVGYLAGRWPLDPDKSTLIFVHGSGGSSVLWQSQVEALADRVNTLALDLPGHGRSQGPGLERIEDYADAVSEFIESMEVPNVIPCGLSLGGGIVLQLLLDHPARIRAGVLVSTGARLRVMPLIFETIQNDFNAYVESMGTSSVSPKTDPEKIAPLTEATARCRPEVILGDFRACDSFDVMSRVDSIEVPVLVVTSEDDRLTPPKYGAYLEERIRGARRSHIMDAGHLVPMEKPEEVNQAITEFLVQEGL